MAKKTPKKAPPRPTSRQEKRKTPPPPEPRGDQADELTDEDEAILDQAWSDVTA